MNYRIKERIWSKASGMYLKSPICYVHCSFSAPKPHSLWEIKLQNSLGGFLSGSQESIQNTWISNFLTDSKSHKCCNKDLSKGHRTSHLIYTLASMMRWRTLTQWRWWAQPNYNCLIAVRGNNALPGQAVHKLFDTQLADRGLSHAGIWVESFLLGRVPSHSPFYAAVYWKRKKTLYSYVNINSNTRIQLPAKTQRSSYFPCP